MEPVNPTKLDKNCLKIEQEVIMSNCNLHFVLDNASTFVRCNTITISKEPCYVDSYCNYEVLECSKQLL